jgi:hypothetical protein
LVEVFFSISHRFVLEELIGSLFKAV